MGRLCSIKLFKGGFRSNNLDPNARHCMASAVVGFMRTFGMDEPMGCYDDIEHADAFVLWAQTWQKCTQSCGLVSPTAVCLTLTCVLPCYRL
ncbi:hypothetical protein J4731_20845 [Providencia rettgeri]|nr:hypothetical protein [Providencia rettgeri]